MGITAGPQMMQSVEPDPDTKARHEPFERRAVVHPGGRKGTANEAVFKQDRDFVRDPNAEIWQAGGGVMKAQGKEARDEITRYILWEETGREEDR